jgi:EpsI family protein
MAEGDFLKKRAPAILSVFLIGQGALFYGLSRGETAPSHRSLNEFPEQLGVWRMVFEGVMEQEVKEVLRADDYITRDYAAPGEKSANLFVAFFKSQRAGQTPHSPKNCLPGSGWVWTTADTISIVISGRPSPIEVNRYVVSNGESKSLVLYWYQSRGRVVASEYKAAALTAWDAIRYNRTDTALVRVVLPAANGAEEETTKTGVRFIQAFFDTLRRHFPV